METWQMDLYSEYVSPIAIQDISENDVSFFMFNDKGYILDGSNMYVYDGQTIELVEPYIPTLFISKTPAGGGTAYEDYNLLGSGFKDSFSSDGAYKNYQLSLNNLDDTAVTAVVNGTDMTENNGFTVDRVAGKVIFNSIPAAGVNNVIITAYKTVYGYADRIKKCRLSVLFGGTNDSRVFVSGNPDMPNYVFRCGVEDPTYWPENGFYKFPGKVQGFSKQYDYLIVHRDNGIHQVTFDLSDNVATFPSNPINDKVGVFAKGTVDLVENNPVFLSRNGVYKLVSSNVRDEQNVVHISEPVDRDLLDESNLSDAAAIDYKNKYWLAANGNVYILDYTQKSTDSPYGEWIIYDNIPASHFLEFEGDLYFASSKDGMIYKFKNNSTDYDSYRDDGVEINAYWKSKPFTFGADDLKKFVDSIYYSVKPYGSTSLDIQYVTDKETSEILAKSATFNLFDFANMDFANFTFQTVPFPQSFKAKLKAKGVTHFQLIISNSQMDEGLTLLSLGIQYRYQGKIK